MTLRIVQYQTTAFVPRAGLTSPGNTTTWGEYPLNPDVFKKPVAPELQQFSAFCPYEVPTAKTPHGWEGEQLEYKYKDTLAPPHLAVEHQQYSAFPARGAIHTVYPDGFSGQQWDRALSKPLPIPQMRVEEQQYVGFQPAGFILIKPPGGQWGWLHEYRFAKPFPVEEQQFLALDSEYIFGAKDYSGWHGDQLEYKFAVPFPVASQQYESTRRLGAIPPYLPPGAGKRYKPPTDFLPQPAFDQTPNAPFQPIWDRRKAEAAAAVEAARVAALAPPPQPIGPPPLPPLSIFQGVPAQPVPMQPGQAPFGLPTFQQFVPPDPMGLAHRMRETQDISDATAVLRALGLLNDNEG
jgi:hypothetical protein